MLLLSHPTGNANVRALASALHQAGRLAAVSTCLHWNDTSLHARLLPAHWQKQARRRALPDIPPGLIHTHPWREASRLLSDLLHLAPLIRHETGPFSVDAVYHSLDRHTSRLLPKILRAQPQLRSVHTYEDGALLTLRTARDLGLRTHYELPIGHWPAALNLQQEEARLLPEWAATLPVLRDSPEKHRRKDEELSLAHRIVVCSTFALRTLDPLRLPPENLILAPFGAPSTPFQNPPDLPQAPLRLLFVGSLTQRKGLSYLLQSIQGLEKHLTLTLIGRRVAPCPALDRQLPRHRWISTLPHDEILREMSRHHILILPSLFEGFGLVLLEAMSRGMTVIATPHTAAPDILVSGKDGHIVPIRDPQAIRNILLRLLDNPEELSNLRQSALNTARLRTWATYASALLPRLIE